MNAQIEKIEAEGFNIILDGYPRDEYQAKWIMNNMAEKIEGAIILEVPKEELYERLSLRGREDDLDKESIDRRFEIFDQNISAILPLFEEKGIEIRRVNGVGLVEDVTNRFVDVVKKLVPSAQLQQDDVNGDEIERSYGE